jgi:hypothetical protein
MLVSMRGRRGMAFDTAANSSAVFQIDLARRRTDSALKEQPVLFGFK